MGGSLALIVRGEGFVLEEADHDETPEQVAADVLPFLS